ARHGDFHDVAVRVDPAPDVQIPDVPLDLSVVAPTIGQVNAPGVVDVAVRADVELPERAGGAIGQDEHLDAVVKVGLSIAVQSRGDDRPIAHVEADVKMRGVPEDACSGNGRLLGVQLVGRIGDVHGPAALPVCLVQD